MLVKHLCIPAWWWTIYISLNDDEINVSFLNMNTCLIQWMMMIHSTITVCWWWTWWKQSMYWLYHKMTWWRWYTPICCILWFSREIFFVFWQGITKCEDPTKRLSTSVDPAEFIGGMQKELDNSCKRSPNILPNSAHLCLDRDRNVHAGPLIVGLALFSGRQKLKPILAHINWAHSQGKIYHHGPKQFWPSILTRESVQWGPQSLDLRLKWAH